MRSVPGLLACCAIGVLGLAAPPGAHAASGDFELEVRRPASGEVVPNAQRSIEIEGRAQISGGVRNLDLFLVMDTSKSLRRTDPENHRSEGAIGLVRSLLWTDARIGVVDFDKNGKLVAPLGGDRSAVMAAIRGLDQEGKTDLAGGIRTALQGFAEGARPGSTRIMLLFTDGRSKQKAARSAMAEARRQGVSISTLLLGSDEKGAAILAEIADNTGGSFVAVTDPARLPGAFLSLRTGTQRVELRVNDAPAISARLTAEGFSAEAPLELGENRIVVRATSIDGRAREETVVVTVRSPGCAELAVRAEHGGEPAISISRRAVEIVIDASGSMWGQMGGRTKIEIAKEILDAALDWLPADLHLSLRAYGHQYDRAAQNCEDTQLLVPPGSGNRDQIREAIAGLRPKGQTPLGYALAQVSADFGDFVGERAVVLVTDGIESCGGDAALEARSLQRGGTVPVHVIGFGLAGKGDEALSSLRAIAEASGGRFLTAGSASELRQALSTTVGTTYRILRGDVPVARGTLGADDRIQLPAGTYRLQLDSAPPHERVVALTSEEKLTLVLRRDGAEIAETERRAPIGYSACGEDGSSPEAPSAGVASGPGFYSESLRR